MSFDLTVLQTDEEAITAELPATMVFADQEVVCMCGPEMLNHELTEEGFSDDTTIEFRALKSRFKTPKTAPFNNQTFTLKDTGIKYRIKSIQDDFPSHLTYIMQCVNLTK